MEKLDDGDADRSSKCSKTPQLMLAIKVLSSVNFGVGWGRGGGVMIMTLVIFGTICFDLILDHCLIHI